MAALAVVVALFATAAWLLLAGDDGPSAGDAAKAYAAAWSAGRDAEAARLTDRPRAAAEALAASRRGLDGAKVTATAGAAEEDGDTATARVDVSWEVPRVGRFAYGTRLRLARAGERWVVRWSPAAVHPRLNGETRLGTAVDARPRGRILARDGRAIVRPRHVVDVAVQVEPRRATPAPPPRGWRRSTGSTSTRRISRAGSATRRRGRFLPADHAAQGGLRADRGRAARGPGRLGQPADCAARADQDVRRARCSAPSVPSPPSSCEDPGRSAPGDEIGQSGLQAAYERRLASTPSSRVVIRDLATSAEETTLLKRPGRRGRALRTTLDLEVQARGRDGARRARRQRGAGGRAALDGRRAGRRQPAGRQRVRPRAGRPLPARLDVQGGLDRRAAAGRARPRPDGRLPAHAGRRGQAVPELRGRCRRRGPVPAGLRRVVQHRLRVAGRPSSATVR